MIIRFILTTIIIVLISRFIFRFVLPVFQVTRMAQSKMKEMQEQMERMQQQEQAKNQPRKKAVEGDYIDYEEVQ